MQFVVIQKDKVLKDRSIVARMLSVIIINFMLIPMVMMDIAVSAYHAVYFRLNGMPLIPRKNYIVFDRGRLSKLNWAQWWGCVYCDYANGLSAWVKAVVNMTEVYGCAIKHASTKHNQEYQKDYYEYDQFK